MDLSSKPLHCIKFLAKYYKRATRLRQVNSHGDPELQVYFKQNSFPGLPYRWFSVLTKENYIKETTSYFSPGTVMDNIVRAIACLA